MRDDLDIPMPAMGPAPAGNGYRVPRQRPGMDANTKRLAIIAAGIGGPLVVIIGAWSLTGHQRTGVPVVEADSRPVREKPVTPGGMQVAGKDEMILSGQTDGKAALAPPAETPKPEALKAQEQAAATQPAATPPAATPPGTPQVVAAPSSAPAPQRAAPAPRAPAAATHAVPAAAPVALAPPAAKPAPTPKPATAAAPPPAAKPAGNIHVQLAAVASEEAAMREWQRLEKKAPALFGGHKPVVSKTRHDGRVFWRLRTGGFADSAAAKGFCAQARGKGLSCISF